ncbi:rna-directed dna polymerase from mobile element jockey- hypothetical protein [Limosa lapponica baueri]|uniref:Uncharacterized protein n=1 Tax=Limosa lapponica baueri TaxID=1758121 RepID=A0A2I0U810_LIMLA|nr:rna-directed dna polymerase from mobile element jockey- hypothetical protein [Limosa lapponica baueri]
MFKMIKNEVKCPVHSFVVRIPGEGMDNWEAAVLQRFDSKAMRFQACRLFIISDEGACVSFRIPTGIALEIRLKTFLLAVRCCRPWPRLASTFSAADQASEALRYKGLRFSADVTTCVVYCKNSHIAHRCFVPSSKDGIESSGKAVVRVGDFNMKELTNLIAFYDGMTGWVDEGRAVDVVYFDLSNDLGIVSHNILMGKLMKCGLDE